MQDFVFCFALLLLKWGLNKGLFMLDILSASELQPQLLNTLHLFLEGSSCETVFIISLKFALLPCSLPPLRTPKSLAIQDSVLLCRSGSYLSLNGHKHLTSGRVTVYE